MFRTVWIGLLLVFISYTIWVYAYCDTKIIYADTHVKQGWAIWQEKNCQSCHQLYGLGGYMGPDLTNVSGTRSCNYLKTFIKYGTGRMPNFHLADSEVDNVVAFLSWVDKTGRADVPENAVHWSGSYVIDNKQ